MSASDNAFRLDGKIALVTGSGRGIGRAIALALAGAGAEVVLNSRSPAELETVASEIGGHGGRARVLPFDVTDGTAIRAAFSGLSRLDILVNNAGVNRPQPFLEVDEATLDRLIALNVKPLSLSRSKQRGGWPIAALGSSSTCRRRWGMSARSGIARSM